MTGVSPKPALVSGQALGTRLARPDAWRKGLRVFTPRGGSVRIRPWWVERVLFPWIADRIMYGGIRD